MANAKKSSSSKRGTTKSAVKPKRVLREIDEDVEDLELDEDLEDEVIDDVDFDLDDDDIDELEELKEISSDERIIRVEKKANILIVLQIIALILILITMIVCLSGGVSSGNKEKESDTQEGTSSDYTYTTTSFKELTFGEISEASKNKEIIVFMGRQGCYWCSLYAPIISLEAQDNKFDVYYLDFGKIIDFTSSPASIADEATYKALMAWLEASDFADDVQEGIGTPMTFFVKNNKIVNMINGYTDQDSLEAYLKKEGFIK